MRARLPTIVTRLLILLVRFLIRTAAPHEKFEMSVACAPTQVRILRHATPRGQIFAHAGFGTANFQDLILRHLIHRIANQQEQTRTTIEVAAFADV